MNILVIGKFYIEGFALHIAEIFVDMDHNVRHFEPGLRSGQAGGHISHRLKQVRSVVYAATDNLPIIRKSRLKSLWQECEKGPLDLVIVCHDFLWPDEITELKHLTGAQVAMWFPDHLGNFGRSYFMNAPYDALFFKDPYIVHILGDVLRSPVYYLPECFNSKQHWLPEEEIGSDTEYKCDIT